MTGISPKMRGFLIDLDGTLYHGHHRIDGADTLIAYMRDSSLPYRFVTNNSSASPEDVAERLRNMGIPAEAAEVCTSAHAAAKHIAGMKPGASVFVVGEAGLRSAAQEAGLRLTEERPDFVLQGIDRSLTYERLAKAVRFIHEGAEFVLTNPDLLLPSGDGLIPGAGSIGAMLRAAGGKEPTLIGKPSSILMDYSLRSIGLTAEETWVIGDNLATDIAFGKAAGCGTLLVLTGLTTEQNIDDYALQAGCRPDVVCKDLGELLAYIAEHRAN
ncbi:TIGR01457 family HAD-type hydrolase [Paenibacillus arenilitoris]|uniref:Acid sugar phosphatase n=1 Tax=Paenibacillus arenilitoris TaxID=2772299 RepID=A0A927CLM5_9BACL|nr:TIGR01457 family HAD-type hydrolase [Paenibacillus arenilitoris]MBD2869814.1 TIGR01457 family HAD-type hydrolase [Paenibacillus arenilitoris]